MYRVPALICAGFLAAFSAVPIVGGTQSAPAGVAPVQSVNHLQIRVSDLQRSHEFYTKLLGGTIIDTSSSGWTMLLGDTGTWLSLGTVAANADIKPSELDHVGIGINLPGQPEALREALKAAFPSSNVRSPGEPGDATYNRSIYLNDPDGVSIQLVSKNDDGHLPRADATPAVPRTLVEGVVRFRSINHLALRVSERATSQEFYSMLLGAIFRDESRSQITMTLPRASSWLSLLNATPRAPIPAGKLDHLGVGIDFPQDAEGIEALRAKLRAAFPDRNVGSHGTPTSSLSSNYNRSIYVTDPDGLSLQLISSTDDGRLGTPSAN